MTAEDLLERLRSRGVALWVEGERLRYRAPPGAMDEETATHLKAQKTALIELLAEGGGEPESYPLSYGQRGLWLINQGHPESPAYNIPRAARLRGPLNTAALERALNEIVRRHRVLRSRFPGLEGRPIGIAREEEVRLQYTDLREWPETEREEEVRQG